MHSTLTFEVEDSEFLCLRRLDCRRCFWFSVVSPLVWGPSEASVCVTWPCSWLAFGAACWSSAAWSVVGRGRNGLCIPGQRKLIGFAFVHFRGRKKWNTESRECCQVTFDMNARICAVVVAAFARLRLRSFPPQPHPDGDHADKTSYQSAKEQF